MISHSSAASVISIQPSTGNDIYISIIIPVISKYNGIGDYFETIKPKAVTVVDDSRLGKLRPEIQVLIRRHRIVSIFTVANEFLVRNQEHRAVIPIDAGICVVYAS